MAGRSTAQFLALDAGTSGGRAALFERHGRLLAVASTAWSYDAPAEAAPWGRSFDPRRFWDTLAGLARQVLAEGDVSPAQVLAVSATSQRQGIVLLDAAGQALYAGPNQDLRAVYQAAALDSRWDERLYAVTGHRPALLFAPARLHWFRERQPELYSRIASLLMISDWLVYCLSGERCSEPSAAAESQLFDIRSGAWSHDLIAALELPPDIYPPLRRAGAVAGTVTPAAAAATGLRAGTPVVVGGADTQCGLLGMNVLAPGQAGILAGWSMPVQQATAAPLSGSGRLWTSCHLLPQRWVLESNAGPAGRSYTWLRDLLLASGPGRSAGQALAELDAMAAAAPAGAGGALAFLGAQVMHAGELGLAWGGLLFPLGAEFIAQRREHLPRAALENIAFAARANLEQLTAVTGQAVAAVALGGGMARSQFFAQLLADVLGAPVQVAAAPETSCAGAAMCAAVGAGVYDDLTAAAMGMARWRQAAEPQRVAYAEYLDLYERWQLARRCLAELSQQIA